MDADGCARLVMALLARAVRDARNSRNVAVRVDARDWINSTAALNWADALDWSWPPRE